MGKNYWVKRTTVVLVASGLAILGVTATAQGESSIHNPVNVLEEVNGPNSSIFGDITYFFRGKLFRHSAW